VHTLREAFLLAAFLLAAFLLEQAR
jgi:hypothetical protein